MGAGGKDALKNLRRKQGPVTRRFIWYTFDIDKFNENFSPRSPPPATVRGGKEIHGRLSKKNLTK
ncbi:MAG: hypothetical protein JSW39_12870, partial [Desulfobacterales bacterium]